MQLLIATDRLREARAQSLRLVQLEPHRAESVAMVAYCDVLLGRPRAALDRLDAAVGVPRPAPALDLVRALALAADGEIDSALELLEDLSEDPEHGAAARARQAALLADLGRREDARRVLADMRRRHDPSELVDVLGARLD